MLLDALRKFQRIAPRLRSNQYEGKLRALTPNEVHRLAVARVHDWVARERRRGVGDADNGGLVIVKLKRAIELEWLVGKQQHITRLVDNYGIRLAKTLPRSEQHLARRARERGVVETEADRDVEFAIERARDRITFEKFHRPLDALYAAHAGEVSVFERLGLLEILGLGIHHPNLRVGDIGNLAAGALHYSCEDGTLVLQQKRAKGDGENKAEIFGPITGEHLECDEVHQATPSLNCLRRPLSRGIERAKFLSLLASRSA